MSSTCASRKKSFFSVVTVYFLNNFSLAVIYPIFTGLILHRSSGLLPTNIKVMDRLPYLGVAMGAFPLFMLIGAIVFQKLEKKFSHKKLLVYSNIGIIIGCCITSCAIYTKIYFLLVFGRAFAGFFAGNISICLLIIATLFLNHESRAKNFAFLGSLTGIGFILSILIGGLFSDKELFNCFDAPLPFFITAALYLISTIFVLIFYKEHGHFCEHIKHENFSNNVFPLLKKKRYVLDYLIFFFLILGWFPTIQFLATDILIRFQGNKFLVTKTLTAGGIVWFIGITLIAKKLQKHFLSSTLLKIFIFLVAVSLILSTVCKSYTLFVVSFLCCVLFASIAWSTCLHMISEDAVVHDQGKVLGMNQSVITFCMMIGPMFIGAIFELDISNIYLVNSASAIISFFILSFKNKIFNLKN